MTYCEQFHNKNQFLLHNNGTLIFQSYDSTIAILSTEHGGTLTLGRDWNYSQTTLKHLYLFIKEYIGDISKFPHIDGMYKFLTDHIDFYKFESSKNKRAFIQNLIDNNIIKYDKSL